MQDITTVILQMKGWAYGVIYTSYSPSLEDATLTPDAMKVPINPLTQQCFMTNRGYWIFNTGRAGRYTCGILLEDLVVHSLSI